MKLIKFKENNSKQIIVTDQGEQEVDEYVMSCLWWNWFTHEDAEVGEVDKDFIVFSFSEPVDYESFLKEGLRIKDECRTDGFSKSEQTQCPHCGSTEIDTDFSIYIRCSKCNKDL